MVRGLIVITLFCCIILRSNRSYAQSFDVVVAADGSGRYTSIADALRNRTLTDRLFIKNGTYREKLSIGSTLSGVSIIGESKEGVIIEWDDYSGDADNHTTGTSYTVQLTGNDLYLANLTIKNTAGNVGQAVAIHTKGSRQVFKNCKFEGFQDTYYAHSGMQYNVDCEVIGATDFIFGDATSVFQNSDIICVSGGQYITAPADTKLITQVDGQNFYHGLLFLESNILAGDGVGAEAYYLGRPWQANSSSVYVNCRYDDHIRSAGWSEWNDNNHLSAVFAEYGNVDMEGNAVDVSSRVDWSKQLTSAEAENYYNIDYFLDGWDPIAVTMAPSSPSGLAQDMSYEGKGFSMTWDVVEDVAGYVVFRNGDAYAFPTESVYTDTLLTDGDEISVKTVAPSGELSQMSESLTLESVLSTPYIIEQGLSYKYHGRELAFDELVSIEVYTLAGKIVKAGGFHRKLELSDLRSGLYVIWARSHRTGEQLVLKVAL